MSTVKIALASFAHVHAASYAQLLRDWPGVELLCADPDSRAGSADEVRGSQLAEQLGVPYVDDYDALFAWAPDAVVVCSENTRHRELVVRAAQQHVHVLCEKPLATSVADGEAMMAECLAGGVFLMTAYPVRFAPQFATLRQMVSDGALGQLLMAAGTNNGRIPVDARAWFTNPALSGGGALVDHVVHVADLLDVLVGGVPAESVRAVANRILHADKPHVRAETGALVTVTYPGGLTAVIDCSWSQPDHAPTWGGLALEVTGTRGTATIDPFAQRVDGFRERVPGPLWAPYGPDLDQRMLAAFLDGVRTGVPPQPDGAAGLRTLRIVTAAQESVRTGAVVKLSPDH